VGKSDQLFVMIHRAIDRCRQGVFCLYDHGYWVCISLLICLIRRRLASSTVSSSEQQTFKNLKLLDFGIHGIYGIHGIHGFRIKLKENFHSQNSIGIEWQIR
jgi:hypothetical protein